MSPSMPSLLLCGKGLALLIGAAAFYGYEDASWLMFALLFLAPDVAMVGFVSGPRVGAIVYNAAHTTTVPLSPAAFGLISGQEALAAIGLIWLAHIGLGRLVGYGLKYPGNVKQTYLGRV